MATKAHGFLQDIDYKRNKKSYVQSNMGATVNRRFRVIRLGLGKE